MDSSGDGLGAVLAQRQEVRPASRSLQKHEKNYGITELEGLGVVWAARPYLYGHHCTVFTDHEALKSLLNTPQPSGKLARWGMALQELDLKIERQANTMPMQMCSPDIHCSTPTVVPWQYSGVEGNKTQRMTREEIQNWHP